MKEIHISKMIRAHSAATRLLSNCHLRDPDSKIHSQQGSWMHNLFLVPFLLIKKLLFCHSSSIHYTQSSETMKTSSRCNWPEGCWHVTSFSQRNIVAHSSSDPQPEAALQLRAPVPLLQLLGCPIRVRCPGME